jgi:TspO/MBR family
LFGLKAEGLTLVEILALWTAILLTTLAFSRVSRPAGWLLVPNYRPFANGLLPTADGRGVTNLHLASFRVR